MDITVRKADGVTIVELAGALLVGEADRICRDTVRQQLDAGERRLAVDLEGVPYMDSSGIGALVRVYNAVQQAGARCRFYGATPKVRQLLRMVRLDTVLELVEDERSALASL